MTVSSIRKLALGVAVIAGSALAVEPADAAPLVREHYSFTDSGSFDDCGFQIDWTATGGGVFMLKEGRRGDPTPYLFDNYEYHNVFTNPANGNWFTRDGNGLYKDLHIVNIEGTVYRFESVENGQPFVISDSDGNVVIRDRGQLRTGFIVDTKGDDDLENDEFIEGSDVLLADHGSHPQWHRTQDEYCAIVNDLLQ